MAHTKSGSDDEPQPGVPEGSRKGVPKMRKKAVDAAWADIVDGLGDLGSDVDVEAELAKATPPARVEGPRDWFTSDAVAALEDEESRFTPPDPGPVAVRDRLRAGAIVLMIVAVVASLALNILGMAVDGFRVPLWLRLVLGAAFIASIGVLLWRMPARRDRDPWDTDSGAVV